MYQNYDKKYLLKCLGLILLSVLVMKLSLGYGYALIALFLYAALLKNDPVRLFFWQLLTIALMVGNPNFIPKNAVFFIMQRMALGLLAMSLVLQMFTRPRHRYVTPLIGIFGYVGFMFVPSLLGWSPVVSFLKLLLFSGIFLAFFGVANFVCMSTRDDMAKVSSVVLSIAIFFIFGSMLLIPFPGYGNMMLEGWNWADMANLPSLFMGMANHSQALGPIVASFATVLVAEFVFSVRRFDWLYVSLILCCPIIIYKTASRTAMGTFICGIIFVLFFFGQSRGVGAKWRGKVLGWSIMVGVLLSVIVVAIPSTRDYAVKFILKTQEVTRKDNVSLEGVTSSRQGLIENSLYNFRRRPIIGNGFQVSEQMVGLDASRLTRVLSAPIEKGVWYAAVLEEGGIIGMILFCGYLVTVMTLLLKRHAFIGAAALFVLWLSNFGEFTFFSLSYTGGVLWALVFAGIVLDVQRLKQQQKEDYFQSLQMRTGMMSL